MITLILFILGVALLGVGGELLCGAPRAWPGASAFRRSSWD